MCFTCPVQVVGLTVAILSIYAYNINAYNICICRTRIPVSVQYRDALLYTTDATYCSRHALAGGVAFNDPQRCLPAPAIFWSWRFHLMMLAATVRSQQGEGASICLKAALLHCENSYYANRCILGLNMYWTTWLCYVPANQKCVFWLYQCFCIPAFLFVGDALKRLHLYIILHLSCNRFLPYLQEFPQNCMLFTAYANDDYKVVFLHWIWYIHKAFVS